MLHIHSHTRHLRERKTEARSSYNSLILSGHLTLQRCSHVELASAQFPLGRYSNVEALQIPYDPTA